MSARLLALPSRLKCDRTSLTAASTAFRPSFKYLMPSTAPISRCYSSDNAGSRRPFIYHLAASSSPKRAPPRSPRPGRDFWNYASTEPNISPPYLRSTQRDSGEDAFFATTVGGSNNSVAFGVADGVGGWQDSGVDPSDYSQGLCGLMAGTANTYDLDESGKALRPLPLLQTAYDAVMTNPRIQAGGCTASLAVADAEGSMECANLGDSGYIVIKPGKVHFQSKAQTHAFNTPYQFSKIPPKMQAQYAIFGGAAMYSETPKDADIVAHQLKHGDIVAFATDGVWDNLSAQDTLAVVTKVMEDKGFWFRSHNFDGAETMLNESLIKALPTTLREQDQATYLPGLLAAAIMREAKVAGLDRKRNGPFAKEVKKLYPREDWQGGKPDDIAVVICIAVQSEMAQDAPVKAHL